MSSGLWTAVLTVALGAGPYGYDAADPNSYGGYPVQPGYETYGGVPAEGYAGPVDASFAPGYGGSVGGYGGGQPDQLYPYDAPEKWLHGHFQEIPAYGGFHSFQPYNYKHVLAQSQAAGGWGMSPTMPYSQQFWHRYHDRAALKQHLSQVGLSEYTAELARIRAQHDFEMQERLAGRSGAYSEGNVPAEFTEPRGDAREIRPAGAGDPAEYERLRRIEELQYRIRVQTEQIRALEEALRRQRQDAAAYPREGQYR